MKPLGDICEISGEHAGVHILLTFKNGQKERNLIEKAKKADIRVYGLSDYRIRKDEKEKATILLGYANMREEDIKEAVAILNQCWRKIESVSNILERKKSRYIISNGENKKIALLISYTALLYLCMQKDYWIQKCLLQ